jgi:hypothetical protein
MSAPAAPPPPFLPIRLAACAAAATLVAYVGVVHEVVGATLYPDGPAAFGGPLGWHAAGIAGIAAGVLLGAGVLGLLPVPVAPLAAAVGVIGAVVFAADLWRGSFHLFAGTLVAAGGFLVLAAPPRREPDRTPSPGTEEVA